MPSRIHRTPLCAALALALALPAYAQDTGTQTGEETTTTLDRISVTGTRIRRTDVEEALPITVLDKEEIEKEGITSAEQLLMRLNVAGNGMDNLASNAGILTGIDQRGNNGVSGANLRGQGAEATLVLLNGRRVATHGLKGRVVDLNSIPFAAIDRVEVLRDGASALYGTDAIGGVINFITRRDYTGGEASAFIDATEEGDGNIYRASVLLGTGDLDTDRWNVFGTLSYKRSELIRGNARDFSNGFQPERGLSPDTRGAPFATVFNQAGSMTGNGLIDPLDGQGVNGVNILDLPGAAGCASGGDGMGAYDDVLWGSPSARYGCSWDYPSAAALQQPTESLDFVGRATFALGDNHRAYVEVVGSEVDAEKIFEPNQISSSALATATFNPTTWYPATGESYDLVYDALAAYFGAGQLTYGAPIAYRWRCTACGPRQIATNTKSYRFLVGFEGLVGSWDYNIGLSRASSESTSELSGGYYFTDGLQQVLGSGLINPFLLPGQSQSAEGMAALEAVSASGVVLYGGETVMTQLDAVFSGGLGWNLPGGEVQAAAGLDLRREEYLFNGDDRAEQRAIFNAPFDNDNALDNVSRDVKAVFAEFYFPILDNLDITLAGRHDRYDGFGSTTNPKFSFKWQPIEELVFRGAYSTGFLVPNFNQLYYGVTESPYTGKDLADPGSCPGGVPDPDVPGCEQVEVNLITGGKADLSPEESTQKSFGVVFAPNENFNVAVDWWEIERENTVRSIDVDTLIEYYDLFQDNWVRDASGELVAIDSRYVNSGGSLTRGVELDANAIFEGAGGTWRIGFNGSYLDTYKTKALASLPYTDNLVGEYVRYVSLPIRWKHTLSVGYEHGNWQHNLSQLYRHGYKDELPPGIENGDVPAAWDPDVDSYTTYNYNVTYRGFEDLRLSFGIKNLLDTDPPFTAHQNDFAAGAGWEPRIADPRGRSYTFLVEYKFF